MTRLRCVAAFWIFVAAGIVVLGGCEQPEASSPPQQRKATSGELEVLHDDARNVTCWRFVNNDKALSCLPDWMLTKRQGIPVQGGAQ